MTRNIKTIYCMIVILSIILLCCWMGTLYTTYLFPIYPDEIARQILSARIGTDFPIQFDLLPMCKTHSPHYSVVWYFPAFVEWVLHGHIYNLKILRLLGLLTNCLLFFFLIVKLCQKNINIIRPFYSIQHNSKKYRHCEPWLSNLVTLKATGLLRRFAPRNDYYKNGIVQSSFYQKWLFIFISLALVVSLFEIGVVPFFLVTMRPEQLLLICLSILLIIFSIPAETNTKKIIFVLVYYISVSILLYQHPKSLFLTPILLVIAYRLFSRFNKSIFVSLFLLLFFLIIANYDAWITTFVNCPASPKIDVILKAFNIDFHNMTKAPSVFFTELWQSLLDYKTEIHRIGFQTSPEINYIPSVTMNHTIKVMNKIISVNYFVIFWVTFVASMIINLRDWFKKKLNVHHLLTIVLFLYMFANVLINKCKHWYDAGYLWSVLVITFIFFISEYLPYLAKRKTTCIVIMYLFMVSIFSQYLFIKKYEPALKSGFAGPGISIADYHHETIESELGQLASLCHIDRKKSKNLILDDLTYSYFQQSQYPLAFTYLTYGIDQNFLRGFLNKFQVDGLILRELYLPEPMRKKYAIKVGQFICVAKPNIKPLFEEYFALILGPAER